MSHIDYGSLMYNIASAKSLKQIAVVQKKAIRATFLAKYNVHLDPFLISNKLLNLTDQLEYNKIIFMHKFRFDKLPPSFINMFQYKNDSDINRLRHDDGNFHLPTNDLLVVSPVTKCVLAWNALPNCLRSTHSPKLFKKELKDYFISKYSPVCVDTNCWPCRKN